MNTFTSITRSVAMFVVLVLVLSLASSCATLSEYIPPIDVEVTGQIAGVEATVGGKVGDGVFAPKIGVSGFGGAIGTGVGITIGRKTPTLETGQPPAPIAGPDPEGPPIE